MSTTLATINAVINDRRRDTGTTSVDMTADGFRAINSTLQVWSEIHDWPWTIQTAQFNYNAGISRYAISLIASDFKYDITLKMVKPGEKMKEFDKVSPLKFDSSIYLNRYAVDIVNQTQILQLKTTMGSSSIVETAGTFDGNGTWVGASAISNVGTDSYEGFDLTSSVSFDYSGTSGTLTNSTLAAVDLSSYVNRSNLYMNVYFSTVANLSSVTLKWGTDASNYYSVTATTNYLGQSFSTGWNKVKFAWSNPTKVGTPTNSSISYLQVTIAFSVNPSASGFRIENIFISENVPMELKYYSVNMAYDVSAAAASQIFTDASHTTDYPLWSGRWDVATEPFINSVLETIFWMTGQYDDKSLSEKKILEIVEPLKKRFPSQRRYAKMQIVTDTNLR